MNSNLPKGPRPHWLAVNGHALWPAELSPSDIFIDDIAWALARQCRWGGHLKPTIEFYSVAEHSFLVAAYTRAFARIEGGYSPAALDNLTLQALLHDAPEYLLGDLCAPIKTLPQMSEYREVETAIWQAVAQRFDIPNALHPFVKRADAVIAATEARLLTHWPWPCAYDFGEAPDETLLRDGLVCMSPATAREIFLEAYCNITTE